MADVCNITATQVRRAKKVLIEKLKIVESVARGKGLGRGHGRAYRIREDRLTYEYLSRFEPRKRREHKPSQTPAGSIAPGETIRLKLGRQAKEVDLQNHGASPIEVATLPTRGSVPQIAIASRRAKPLAAKAAGADANTAHPCTEFAAPAPKPNSPDRDVTNANTAHPCTEFAARAPKPNSPDHDVTSALRKLLTPIFQAHFHRLPDTPFISQIARRLGHATVEHYGNLLKARLQMETDREGKLTLTCRDKHTVASGLFLKLADDASHAAASLPAGLALSPPGSTRGNP